MQMQSWLRAEQCRKRGRSRTNTLAERTQNHHQESDNHNHIVPSDPILISLIKSVYLPLLLTVTLGKQEATILYSAKKYFLCISYSFYLFPL